MKLTETDKKILESYKTMVDGLSLYLGRNCEIVLHSLEDYEKSVIKIVNGERTGRKVGAPITNLALSLLNELNENSKTPGIAYFNRNANNEPTKSATIAIRGEKNKIIGLVCINYYLDTPFIDFLDNFACKDTAANEVFTDNKEDIIDKEINNAKILINNDDSILPSLKNKKIIEHLYNKGIFNLKNSIEYVAKELDLSINTVYLHVRNFKK